MYLRLRARLAERVAAWARRRQGDDVLPLRLQARRLYILPTRAGLASALLLFVMLVAGLNYANSLALLLTFMLAGFVLVGMHECQRTLQGLELAQAQAADCQAGDTGEIELRFSNPGRQARRAISVNAAGARATHFDIDAGAIAIVKLPFHAPGRGRHRLGRLQLASTAPFGLFRCWTWLHLPQQVYVYPKAAGLAPLPRAAASRRSLQTAVRTAGEDEWEQLRAYQHGDSPRSIAWKAWARGAPLMVGQYAGSGGGDHLLSFAGLETLDLEARLSQLCAWVLECSRQDAACALRLPGHELPCGRGAAHRTLLLRALALHGSEAAAS
jgi:uncharacterized protein (DUF58 family)